MIQAIKEWYSLSMLAYVVGRYPRLRIELAKDASRDRIVRVMLLVGNDMLHQQEVVVVDGDRELRRRDAVAHLNARLVGAHG